MRTHVVKLAENVKQGCDGNGCEIRRDEGESSEILNKDDHTINTTKPISLIRTHSKISKCQTELISIIFFL
jgi:hypothetical protein